MPPLPESFHYAQAEGGEREPALAMLSRQVVGGVVMLLVGAVFSFLLTTSATGVRIANVEEQIRDLRAQQAQVQQDLGSGGPQPLALRVTAIENTVKDLRAEVKDIYTVVVLKQPVPGR